MTPVTSQTRIPLRTLTGGQAGINPRGQQGGRETPGQVMLRTDLREEGEGEGNWRRQNLLDTQIVQRQIVNLRACPWTSSASSATDEDDYQLLPKYE